MLTGQFIPRVSGVDWPYSDWAGGGGILPALTLDVYKFFHRQVKPTMVTFPKIYLATNWHSKCLSITFDFTMETTF